MMSSASSNSDEIPAGPAGGTYSIKYGSIRRLSVEECSLRQCKENGYCWVVESPFECTTPDGQRIVVPVGFLSDGSSGGPDIGTGWLFHDWLYATHLFDDGSTCTREEADRIMYDLLNKDNLGLYGRAVRFLSRHNVFYCFSRAWNSSGSRGPQLLHECLAELQQ